MISLALALLLSQTQPTRPEIIGAINTMKRAAQDARAGLRPGLTRTATRVCIPPAGGTLPAGTKTIRFKMLFVSAALQRIAFQGSTATDDAPVIGEVQAVASDTPEFLWKTLRENVDVFDHATVVEVREAPLYPSCEVALALTSDAAAQPMLPCACAASSACKLADGVTAAPTGVTLGEGQLQFTPSAACVPKLCSTRWELDGRDLSWPAACPR